MLMLLLPFNPFKNLDFSQKIYNPFLKLFSVAVRIHMSIRGLALAHRRSPTHKEVCSCVD